jgi:hypothetical protein
VAERGAALVNGLFAAGFLAGAWLGAVAWRRWAHRRRLRRQLADAESEVAAAVREGRLEATTGEALLQHLEGLRREAGAAREH